MKVQDVEQAVMSALDEASIRMDGPDEPGYHFKHGTILLAADGCVLVETHNGDVRAFRVDLFEETDPNVAADLYKQFQERCGNEVTE